MDVLRTPDDRFENLKDWPFAPRYVEVSDGGAPLRLHYVDEGPRDGAIALLMHGEPSWAYLYRHVIPGLVARGRRVVAPDLIGFGRSDKPSPRSEYTYERHVAWMTDFLRVLDLRGLTLFCQDWGGLIGLRLVAGAPERFDGVVVSNTGMPTGHGVSEAFMAWLNFSQSVPVLPVGAIVNGGTQRDLTPDEIQAYDAPFPDESYKEGARQFPALVPITPEHGSVQENIKAWTVLEQFEKPFVTAFSDADPVTKGGEAMFQSRVPGARGQAHVTLKGGHFIQEDAQDAVVEVLDALMAKSSAAAG